MDEGVLGRIESQSADESVVHQLRGPSLHSGPQAGLRRSARVQAQLKAANAAVPMCKLGQVRRAANDSFPFGITSPISSPLGPSYDESPRYEPLSPSFPPGLGFDFGGMAVEPAARGA